MATKQPTTSSHKATTALFELAHPPNQQAVVSRTCLKMCEANKSRNPQPPSSTLLQNSSVKQNSVRYSTRTPLSPSSTYSPTLVNTPPRNYRLRTTPQDTLPKKKSSKLAANSHWLKDHEARKFNHIYTNNNSYKRPKLPNSSPMSATMTNGAKLKRAKPY